MVDKQVANSQSPFGRRVESCAVRRQSKRILTYLKTLTSFRVACPSEFKKPRSHCDCRKRAGRTFCARFKILNRHTYNLALIFWKERDELAPREAEDSDGSKFNDAG